MASPRSTADALDALVARGRGRVLAQLCLRDALLAAAIALGGVAALLFFGAELFPPFLLWIFVAAGIAIAGYDWSSSRPTAYETAQKLDARCGGDDQISTACYFASRAADAGSLLGPQRKLAEQASILADPRLAFPLKAPREAWGTGVMLVVSTALLALRLSLQPSLSLDAPLAAMLFPSLAAPSDVLTAEQRQAGQGEREDSSSLNEAGQEESDARPPGERPEPLTLAAVNDPGDRAGDKDFEMPEVEGLSLEEEDEFGDEMAFESRGRSQDGAPDPEADPAGAAESGEGAEEDLASDWSEESNDLLERLKDAFRDMLESLGMEAPESSESSAEAGGEGEQGSEAADQPGQGGKGEQEAAGEEPGGEEMEDAAGAEGASQQAAAGQGGDDSAEAGEESQAASASGTGEGSKELGEAEALDAAMDALEEFYMQRAEKMSGEVMVETSSAEQTARTPYRPSQGSRRDRGGVVSRDEIPAAYRAFIENYFRNLRAKDNN